MKSDANPSVPDAALQDAPDADSSRAADRHFILGTAGHIDHGKTALIRALSGTDTDRLPEEKRRGMTIELGFAELVVEGRHYGIVDVPGHERFVRTMVAGATGIDLALIVVAADDSVMPQTREHVEILNLLNVHHAVVAVTKIDTVDDEMVELVIDDVERLLAGTPLEDAPICPVSSITGAGLDELKRAIVAHSRSDPAKSSAPPFHVAVDRVFTVQGRGTVVTGSVLRGSVTSGDELAVLPDSATCRVRDLQAHGAEQESLARGQRAAINISGIERDRVPRGSELATPGYLTPARVIGVRLHCLSSYGRPLKSTSTVRLCMGTREVPVRVVLLSDRHLAPGEFAYAQLRCGETLTATFGRRFIIRDENATRTIGGGIVLDPLVARRRTQAEERAALERRDKGSAIDRIEEALRSAGLKTPTHLELCARTGVELGALPAMLAELERKGRWVSVAGTDLRVVPAALEDVADRFLRYLERFHRDHPDLPGLKADAAAGRLERLAGPELARPLLDKLHKEKRIKPFGSFVCLPAFAPKLSAADEKILDALVAEVRAGAFQPPLLDAAKVAQQADRKRLERLATLAVAMGEMVSVAPKLYLHVEHERRLRETVRDLIENDGDIGVGEVREALNSSRKYVVPFLEYLDRIGYTRRVSDRRVLVDPAGKQNDGERKA